MTSFFCWVNIVQARQVQKTLVFVTGELHYIVDRTKLRALDFETISNVYELIGNRAEISVHLFT